MVTIRSNGDSKFRIFEYPETEEELYRTLELPFDCANGFAPSHSLKPYIRFAC